MAVSKASGAWSGVLKCGEVGGDWERSSVSSSEHRMSWGVVSESSTVLNGEDGLSLEEDPEDEDELLLLDWLTLSSLVLFDRSALSASSLSSSISLSGVSTSSMVGGLSGLGEAGG